MRCLLTMVVLLAATATESQAGPFRRRAQAQSCQSFQFQQQSFQQSSFQQQSFQPTTSFQPGFQQSSFQQQSFQQSSFQQSFTAGNDALSEVNAARASRGLRPFLPDPGLTAGAQRAAQERAARGITGHLPNDFAMLPPGAFASAGGCAAWPQGMGWGSCCTYDTQYTYAGAAAVVGRDGRRYMHLFVR